MNQTFPIPSSKWLSAGLSLCG